MDDVSNTHIYKNWKRNVKETFENIILLTNTDDDNNTYTINQKKIQLSTFTYNICIYTVNAAVSQPQLVNVTINIFH